MRHAILGILTLACSATALARNGAGTGLPDHAEASPTPWNIGISVSVYFFENQTDFVSPTVTADHGALHLEGRYNYEAQQTGSVWVGWNLAWGDKLKLALTPMIGGVFGDVNGFAPGLEWTLSWGPFALFSENEFVFALSDWSRSDFYVWSQLTGQPTAWLNLGIALQRTRAFESPEELQWGPLLGVAFWKLSATGYWFNPGQTNAQYWIATIGLNL